MVFAMGERGFDKDGIHDSMEDIWQRWYSRWEKLKGVLTKMVFTIVWRIFGKDGTHDSMEDIWQRWYSR